MSSSSPPPSHRKLLSLSGSVSWRKSKHDTTCDRPAQPQVQTDRGAYLHSPQFAATNVAHASAHQQITPRRFSDDRRSEVSGLEDDAAAHVEDVAWLCEMRHAGHGANDLRHLGASATALREAGFTARELRAAQYPRKQCLQAGYSKEQLLLAGFGQLVQWRYQGITYTSTLCSNEADEDSESFGGRGSDVRRASDVLSSTLDENNASPLEVTGPSYDDWHRILKSGSQTKRISSDFVADDPDAKEVLLEAPADGGRDECNDNASSHAVAVSESNVALKSARGRMEPIDPYGA